MKIKGSVTETRIVEAEVEIEVPDDADDYAITEAVRQAAYESTSWECIKAFDVEEKWNREFDQWSTFKEPQEICPRCESDHLANEDGPDEYGRLPVTCHECGLQWYEPCDTK